MAAGSAGSATATAPALLGHHLRGSLIPESLGLRQRRQPMPLPLAATGAAATFCAAVLRLAARNRPCREYRMAARAVAQEDEVPTNFLSALRTRGVTGSRRDAFAAAAAAAAGTVAAASILPASAQAEEVDPRTRVRLSSAQAAFIRDTSGEEGKKYYVDMTRCLICVGAGLTTCVGCEGTGQTRMLGRKDEDRGLMARDQYRECPDCGGLGEQICAKCYGTGMPADKLRGFMRDPKFAKVLFRLKRQRVDVNTVDKIQRDIKQAIAAAENRKEKRAAEKAAEAAAAAATS
eukprot:TRINITY_DN21071_c0_g1_i2.p1 TRINITY_DN21071_c0_g1~~TRINITY_DN21071_c0_g1_i2.p1  ORF type:complete len:318 (+),score=68.51 TRINITY_DN21071_c0_g1_i2:84-956(+)